MRGVVHPVCTCECMLYMWVEYSWSFATNGGLKRPCSLSTETCLFLPPLWAAGCSDQEGWRVPCGLQSSTEPPYMLQCSINRGEWEMGRGGEEGKDSTRSHPTHSDCHWSEWIILSWKIFQAPEKSPCCSPTTTPRIFRPMQRPLSSYLVIAIVSASFICLSILSILASTQDWPQVSLWCCEIFSASQGRDRLLQVLVWWSEILFVTASLKTRSTGFYCQMLLPCWCSHCGNVCV